MTRGNAAHNKNKCNDRSLISSAVFTPPALLLFHWPINRVGHYFLAYSYMCTAFMLRQIKID